jgi:predicted ATPase
LLSKIKFQGLKSIDCIELNLKKLNLLIGVNSAGKSTIIQGLLVLAQNFKHYDESSVLNGHLISLGTYRDVRNFNTNAQFINLEITNSDNAKYSIFIQEDKDSYNDTAIKYLLDSSFIDNLNYNKDFYYLSSSRIGYKDIYEKNIEKIDKFGLLGEYAIYYYNIHKTDSLEKNLIKDNLSTTLESQLNFWLNYIAGSTLKTEDIEGTDKLKAQYTARNLRTVRPKNIGTGLSYIISILIICLASKVNDVIIIENPEIHLHPKAQSRLCEFLCFIAKNNRQLIIESHSDHIFNEIRVELNNGILLDEEVSVNFLSIDENTFCTQNHNVRFGTNGRILSPVTDLFDQFDNDLDRLLGI